MRLYYEYYFPLSGLWRDGLMFACYASSSAHRDTKENIHFHKTARLSLLSFLARDHMYKCLEYTLPHLLRPNMVIYLDAPVDVVQKNIATRGNEWDKNSPVWSNDRFLDGMYTAMKRDYLKKIQ